MTDIVRIEEQPAGVHKSRWGLHPCSFATFVKLKRLCVAVRKAERICHQFKRWFRKAERNRVARPRIRNDKGWVIGYGVPVPIPEPKASEQLATKLQFMRHIDINGVFHADKVPVEFMNLSSLSNEIMSCRYAAQKPMPTAEDVKKLSLSDEAIDQLFAQFCPQQTPST